MEQPTDKKPVKTLKKPVKTLKKPVKKVLKKPVDPRWVLRDRKTGEIVKIYPGPIKRTLPWMEPKYERVPFGTPFKPSSITRWVLQNKETGEIYNKYSRKPDTTDIEYDWISGRKLETLGKLQIVEV